MKTRLRSLANFKLVHYEAGESEEDVRLERGGERVGKRNRKKKTIKY